MSAHCKSVEIPLVKLRPAWIEFTKTKGVLYVLKPHEKKERAQGLVFDCPRCRHDPQKRHYCIFLFDHNAPEWARPPGRFIPSWEAPTAIDARPLPEDFDKLSLWMIGKHAQIRTEWLIPGDLKCRWDGMLHHGVVSWKPSMLERAMGRHK